MTRKQQTFSEGERIVEQPMIGFVYPVKNVASYPLPNGLDQGTRLLVKKREVGTVTCEDGKGKLWTLNFIQLDTPTMEMRRGKWVAI